MIHFLFTHPKNPRHSSKNIFFSPRYKRFIAERFGAQGGADGVMRSLFLVFHFHCSRTQISSLLTTTQIPFVVEKVKNPVVDRLTPQSLPILDSSKTLREIFLTTRSIDEV